MRLDLSPDMMDWLKKDMEEKLLHYPSMQEKLNAQYIIGKIIFHQNGRRMVLLPNIKYDCPQGHRININNYYREIFCEKCNQFFKKTQCARYRVYKGGTKKKDVPIKRRPYSHEYYLRRKSGLTKKNKPSLPGFGRMFKQK